MHFSQKEYEVFNNNHIQYVFKYLVLIFNHSFEYVNN